MIGLLKGLRIAPWLPYAAVGALAVGGALYGWGYLAGMHGAEERHLKDKAKAIEAALIEQRKESDRRLQIAVANERAKHEVHRRINTVEAPAVSCDLPPDCLRWHDDILRAANNTPEPD